MKAFQAGLLSIVLCAAMLAGAQAGDSRRHLLQTPAGAHLTSALPQGRMISGILHGKPSDKAALLCQPADCVTRLTGLAGSCTAQIQAITMQAQSIPVDATDDEIKARLVGQPAPTAACCTAANTFITGGCRCDPQTVSIVAAQNINTDSLKTLVRATELSCNLAATIDPCT
ncbi:hypothetical protein COCOBI_09-0530 [Coccomyxa sp. Obi]|nr:hypothetical protein COCOBI_09-0530 [Coccomyxa sp. Obi]